MRKVILLFVAVWMAVACGEEKPLIPLPDSGITEGGETEGGETEGGNESSGMKGYYEVPAMLKGSPEYKYVTHYAATYRSGKYVRNYSACYDVRRHNPLWVAYPLHDIYKEGGYTRPKPDPWRPDPEMTEQEQSVIYASDWAGWPWSASKNKPKDPYNYWSVRQGKLSYIKGHLLRSADRGAGSTSRLLELNVQTFYPTNIAPERYERVKTVLKGDREEKTLDHWTIVEGIAPDKWTCSDTLYVVTGCYYENDSHKVMDASNYGRLSSKSKECVVPTARYKVFLRTKSGNTGKSLSECKPSELMAVAFWFEQCFRNSNYFESLPPLSSVTMSVSELEKRLGGQFDFFPSVPDEVKNTWKSSDWPGLDRVINQRLDENYSGDYIFF